MTPTATSQRFRLVPAVQGLGKSVTTALALGALVLGATACSSAKSAGTTTSTTTQPGSSNGSTTSSTNATTTTSKPASAKATLAAFESRFAGSAGTSFVANYHMSGDSGAKPFTGTLTIAHDGSSSLFSVATATGTFEEITAKGVASLCLLHTGKWECLGGTLMSELDGSIHPFQDLFSSSAQLQRLRAEEATAYDVTESSSTVDGQSVNCVTYHSHIDSGSYTICLTSQGLMASVNGQNTTGHWTMTLTNLSTTVPATEFTLPATVTTVP